MIAQHFRGLTGASGDRAGLGLAVILGLAVTAACFGRPSASSGVAGDSGPPAADSRPLVSASPTLTSTPLPRPTSSPTPWVPPFDLAFVLDGNIWLGRSGQTGLAQLTGGGQDSEPAWSPDGQRLLFGRGQGDARELYSIRSDGSGLLRLTHDGLEQRRATWSPDARRIVFEQRASAPDDGASCTVVVMDADGSRPLPVATGCEPVWSPAGGTLAFVSSPQVDQGGLSQANALRLVQPGGGDRLLLTVADLPTDLEPGYNLPFRPAARRLRAPDWAPSGLILSASVEGQTGLAITLDLQRSQIRMLQANYEGAIGRTRFAPGGGTLAVESRPASGYGHVVLIEPGSGRRVDLGDERLDYSAVEPTWSPDGARLAAVVFRGPLPGASAERELMVFERSGRVLRRVAQGDLEQPAWRGGR